MSKTTYLHIVEEGSGLFLSTSKRPTHYIADLRFFPTISEMSLDLGMHASRSVACKSSVGFVLASKSPSFFITDVRVSGLVRKQSCA